MEKNLENMEKKELIAIIDKLIADRQSNIIHHNRIEVADFIVESNDETLENCKRTIDNLIKQHGNFFIKRKQKAMLERQGMFG